MIDIKVEIVLAGGMWMEKEKQKRVREVRGGKQSEIEEEWRKKREGAKTKLCVLQCRAFWFLFALFLCSFFLHTCFLFSLQFLLPFLPFLIYWLWFGCLSFGHFSSIKIKKIVGLIFESTLFSNLDKIWNYKLHNFFLKNV